MNGFESVSLSANLGCTMVYSHSAEKTWLEEAFAHNFAFNRLAAFLNNPAFSHSSEQIRIFDGFL